MIISTLLAGCNVPTAIDEEATAPGGISPDRVVEKFLEDLNGALADPELSEIETRRAWAERLAAHFAPSERIDQRAALGSMLDRFVFGVTQLGPGETMTIFVTFNDVFVIETNEDRALVGLREGQMTMRWFGPEGQLYRERTRPLMELLGMSGSGLPVTEVGGRWFLTEG